MLPVCSICGQYVRVGAERCPFCKAVLLQAPPGLRMPSASSVALGLSLVSLSACFVGVSKYGVASTGNFETGDGEDDDNDGYLDGEGDCDDENADIHPDAEETPGDGVDSNCDGEDDT